MIFAKNIRQFNQNNKDLQITKLSFWWNFFNKTNSIQRYNASVVNVYLLQCAKKYRMLSKLRDPLVQYTVVMIPFII